MSLTYWIHLLFSVYAILLFARVITSWFPQWEGSRICRFVAFYTDPYLALFRRLLPPFRNGLDLSPILAFLALRLVEILLLGILYQS
jgi:YggT family protein